MLEFEVIGYAQHGSGLYGADELIDLATAVANHERKGWTFVGVVPVNKLLFRRGVDERPPED